MNGASPLNNPAPRLRVSAVVGLGTAVLGLGVLFYYADWSWLPLPTMPEAALSTSSQEAPAHRLPGDYAKDTSHYAGVTTPTVAVPASVLEVPPVVTPLPTFSLPTMPTPASLSPSPGAGGVQGRGTQTQTAPAQRPSTEAVKKPKWGYLATGDQADQGLQAGVPTPAHVRGTAAQGQGSLIKPAQWEIPAAPLKTLYRSQAIQGELLHPLHSDLPGQLHIRTTIPVFDKFGYGTIVLDKGSLIIAVQAGQPQYGQSRLKVTLEQIELATGAVIALRASVNDEDGSSGLSGKVNNHLGKLLLATGISAVLNIGARSVAGTPGPNQYFRNPAQEAVEDIGQGVNQEAQKVVDRELRVPPTIERKAYTFCQIHLLDNIQFNRPPVVAK